MEAAWQKYRLMEGMAEKPLKPARALFRACQAARGPKETARKTTACRRYTVLR